MIKKKDKCRIYLNKPIYIGAVILKKSQNRMYTLHCKCIKVKYGVKAKMLIIDTNNFHYIIKTENVFTKTNKYLTTETMQKNQNIMIIQIT